MFEQLIFKIKHIIFVLSDKGIYSLFDMFLYIACSLPKIYFIPIAVCFCIFQDQVPEYFLSL